MSLCAFFARNFQHPLKKSSKFINKKAEQTNKKGKFAFLFVINCDSI